MNSANPAAPVTPGAGDPAPDSGPGTLGELIAQVMDQRGYRNLRELSRHTPSVPYQTLWAWKEGSRNLHRPPAAKVLQGFAADLNLPEAVVFRAAGRAYPQAGDLDGADLQVLHLYHELAPGDRAIAESLLRQLADRARDQQVTRS